MVNASDSVIQGQEFFRVKQNINSAIPIVPGIDPGVGSAAVFDVTVKSIIIGPDSSFDRYRVYYYDPARGLTVDLGGFSLESPWVGRLDAFPQQIIDPLNQGGKLYVVPQNNFNASIFTVGAGAEALVFPPTIDVIGYFTNQLPTLTGKRSSFLIDTAVPRAANPNASIWWFPYFGRESCDIMLYNPVASGNTSTWLVLGIRMGYFEEGSGEALLSATALNGLPEFFHYESTGRADSKGHFEYIAIVYLSSGGGGTPDESDVGGLRVWFEAFD